MIDRWRYRIAGAFHVCACCWRRDFRTAGGSVRCVQCKHGNCSKKEKCFHRGHR
jgi:hypothetical protein